MKFEYYIPEKGDLVWLNFNPQTGHEQSGRRPALTISPVEYNKKTGLALFCPVTSQVKDYPFEVKLPDNLIIQGVILTDHVKNLDWMARQAEFIDKLPPMKLKEALNKLSLLISS